MAIDYVRSAESAGVGVLDELMEGWDQTKGRDPNKFTNAKNLYRIVVTAAGYALQAFMPKQAKLGETLALSGTPLLAKTVVHFVRTRSATPATAAVREFVPRAEYRIQVPPVATSPIVGGVAKFGVY